METKPVETYSVSCGLDDGADDDANNLAPPTGPRILANEALLAVRERLHFR